MAENKHGGLPGVITKEISPEISGVISPYLELFLGPLCIASGEGPA